MAKESDAPTEPLEEGTTPEGRAEEAFYTAPDGTAYGSPDELHKAWSNFVPKSEYTKKTQGLAQERAEFQRQREAFAQEREQFQLTREQRQEVDRYNAFMQQRPDTAARWKQELANGASPTELRQQIEAEMEKKYEDRFTKLEEAEARREAEAQRKAIYEQMKGKYQDFDEKAIDEMLDRLGGGDPEGVIEELHFARKGRTTPAEIAEELAKGEREKSEGSLPGGTSRGATGGKSYGSVEEAREAGLAKLH